MKAILCTTYGGPELLQYTETSEPQIGEKDVLIQVAACAVNYPDVLIIQNKYQFKPELPFSPGGEVSGIALKVGRSVKHIKEGQKVLALCGWGGFAEKVKVEANRVFPVPTQMDFITAASTLYTFGTSYHALKNRAQIKSGETLLVLGASGGVGLAAVELGKLMGAKVIAAASTEEKLAICKEKGADVLINYEEEDLKEKVKSLTDGKGVDVVLDVVGDKYAEPALRSMAWKGRYLVVGFAAGEIPKLPFNLALLKGCAVMGVFWGRFSSEEPKEAQQNLMELVSHIQKGKIKQHIFKTYSLKDSPSALADMMERKVIGKAVVVVNEDLLAKDKENSIQKAEEVAKENDQQGSAHQETKPIKIKKASDLQNLIGKALGKSSAVTVSQDLIQKFAETTQDLQWIHTDVVKAALLLPEGKNLAHGYLTLSLIPHLLYELLPLDGLEMALNYGTEKVRFPAPVHSGDQIHLEASVLKIEQGQDGTAKLFLNAQLFSNRFEKPVCVAEIISLLRF